MSVVTEQPESAVSGGGGGSSAVPPGLEYLICTDTLIVSQKVELAEAIVGVETANKYTVKNGAGQHVYFAVEESSRALPTCCSYLRAFNIRVMVSGPLYSVFSDFVAQTMLQMLVIFFISPRRTSEWQTSDRPLRTH